LGRKFSDLKRRKPSLAEKRRFILFSEGKNTERVYFEALQNQYPGALIKIEYNGPAGTPISIKTKVEDRMKDLRLEREHNPSAKADTVWAVFDCDQHDFVPESIEGCKRAGGQVAYSNPCFEVWLILHYEDYHAADNHHEVPKRFRKLDPTYDPNGSKIPNCGVLMSHVETAEHRAKNQCKRREEEGAPLGRPSTTVYRLTRAIRAAAEASRLKRP
jgi:hypothetical protein